jgi:hypothetical protein
VYPPQLVEAAEQTALDPPFAAQQSLQDRLAAIILQEHPPQNRPALGGFDFLRLRCSGFA